MKAHILCYGVAILAITPNFSFADPFRGLKRTTGDVFTLGHTARERDREKAREKERQAQARKQEVERVSKAKIKELELRLTSYKEQDATLGIALVHLESLVSMSKQNVESIKKLALAAKNNILLSEALYQLNIMQQEDSIRLLKKYLMTLETPSPDEAHQNTRIEAKILISNLLEKIQAYQEQLITMPSAREANDQIAEWKISYIDSYIGIGSATQEIIMMLEKKKAHITSVINDTDSQLKNLENKDAKK